MYSVPRGVNLTAIEYIQATPSHPLHVALEHPWQLCADDSAEQASNDTACDAFEGRLDTRRRLLVSLAVGLAASTIEAMPSVNHESAFILRVMKRFGLPVRYLGLVRSQCIKPHVRRTVLRTMLAHVLSEVAMEVARTAMERGVRRVREDTGLADAKSRATLREGQR